MSRRIENALIRNLKLEGNGIDPPRIKATATTVTAAGSAQGDAAALALGFQTVTGADGTKGVILPQGEVGDLVLIKGLTAGVLKVYPNSGGQINAIAANGAMSLASGLIPAIFVCAGSAQWYTIPLVPS
jgi:hypothetical protein